MEWILTLILANGIAVTHVDTKVDCERVIAQVKDTNSNVVGTCTQTIIIKDKSYMLAK